MATYSYFYSKELERKLKKLSKKNKKLYERAMKKIEELINSNSVEHYKNFKYGMKDSKRVHVGSFVLVFQFDKDKNEIKFDDFDHHDRMYKKLR